MVVYEILIGTLKYISSPVANVVYTVETELPMLTVCADHKSPIRSPLPKGFEKGEFYPTDKGRLCKVYTYICIVYCTSS